VIRSLHTITYILLTTVITTQTFLIKTHIPDNHQTHHDHMSGIISKGMEVIMPNLLHLLLVSACKSHIFEICLSFVWESAQRPQTAITSPFQTLVLQNLVLGILSPDLAPCQHNTISADACCSHMV